MPGKLPLTNKNEPCKDPAGTGVACSFEVRVHTHTQKFGNVDRDVYEVHEASNSLNYNKNNV